MLLFRRPINRLLSLWIIVLLIPYQSMVIAQSSTNYKMDKDVMDGAGAPSSSVNYLLEDALGQSSATGYSATSNNELLAGYLTSLAMVSTGTEESLVSGTFSLGQNLPNPFSEETWIPYELKQDTHVVIRILDVLGNVIVTLINEHQAPGSYAVNWRRGDTNGRRMANGVYFCQMQAGEYTQVIKMSLIH